MSKDIRLIVALSDLHCGSTYGLLPPGFETLEGNEIGQNRIQKWLWECWQDLTGTWIPSVVGKDEYALVLNGDVIEGIHHHTKEIISPDSSDHVEAARIVCEPLTSKAAKTFLVEGTECHTGSREHTLAKAFGATPDKVRGKAAWERLDIIVGDVRCVFQHHISAAIRTYLEASALSIFLANEQLESVKNQEPNPPRILTCAHRHRFGKFEDAHGMAVVLPPWQMLTRHGRKVVPAARTKPGAVVYDWRKRRDGEMPEVHHRTYAAPPAPMVRL